jgi:nucleotide-binding universal stress UspA family protein
MYRKILVALDGSEHAVRALQQAAVLAHAFDSLLILVHAYPGTSDLLGYSDYARLVAKRKEKGQELLDEMRGELKDPKLVVEEDLLEGPEAEAILNAAEAHEAGLIVMGSRGLGTLKGWLLGSVSRKVSQLAKCPVLLVR